MLVVERTNTKLDVTSTLKFVAGSFTKSKRPRDAPKSGTTQPTARDLKFVAVYSTILFDTKE